MNNRLTGYEGVTNVMRLSVDTVMRAITDPKDSHIYSASMNTIGRLQDSPPCNDEIWE